MVQGVYSLTYKKHAFLPLGGTKIYQIEFCACMVLLLRLKDTLLSDYPEWISDYFERPGSNVSTGALEHSLVTVRRGLCRVSSAQASICFPPEQLATGR